MSEANFGEMGINELRCEVQALRRDNGRITTLVVCLMVLLVAFAAIQTGWGSRSVVAASADRDGIMHVRGLIVEDAKGTERLRLGAPLPDPMGTDGVRHVRRGVISGMIISDATGTERGGYVTSDQHDEAFFTLDSRKGQEVLFLANADGGTNLDLFDKMGNEAQLTVFPDGPKLVLKKAKQIVAQIPAKQP